MKRFSEQFKKKAHEIALSASERDVLRERIVSFIEYHPITAKNESGTLVNFKKEGPFFILTVPLKYLRLASVACLLVVVVGVPWLAEQTVPGDVLYNMKVQVNEEIRSTFAGSGYAKVAWETERMERRIAEARLLAKEGRLTEVVQQEVIAAVALHQAVTEAEIATLRTTDAEAASLAQMTLATVLDVQAASLKANGVGSTTEGVSTVLLAEALDSAQERVSQQDSVAVSYERMVAQLEQETTRGRELLASIKTSATEQEYADIERRLSDIERKISEGAVMSMSMSSSVAMDSEGGEFKQIWHDMQTIITYMTDIDVRKSITIASLVPVVLTPEEERVRAIAAYDEAYRDMVRLENSISTVTDNGVVEKITITLPQIKSLLDSASSSLLSNPKEAKIAAEEALEYTSSLVRLPIFANTGLNDDLTVSSLFSTLPTSTATSTIEVTKSATSTEVENSDDSAE